MEESCRVVFLGESGAGKTCIISRYINGVYEDCTDSTTGASYAAKNIEVQGRALNLEIWDNPGQEKYRALTKIFYKDASIVILVYDVTKRETLEEIKNYWYNQVKNEGMQNVIIGIAGNKCDEGDKEIVSANEGREFARSIGAEFELTSASGNIGIDDLILRLAGRYFRKGNAPT